MKIITTETELAAAMAEQRLNPPDTIDTRGYGNLGFECGCGETHGVNDFDVQRVASALPVKAIYRCSSNTTKIHIKGIFRQKCLTVWSCENSLFDKFTAELS